ncbi:hypothetical protein ACU81Q_04625 [Komagataeibacter melomenusus]
MTAGPDLRGAGMARCMALPHGLAAGTAAAAAGALNVKAIGRRIGPRASGDITRGP